MIRTDDRSPTPAVNFAELLARVDNDSDLLCELLNIFKEEFPHLLQVLQEAVDRADMEHVKFTCHTLRGMLSGLSVTRAVAATAQLEEVAGQNQESGLRDALAVFEHEVADLLPELDRYMAEGHR